MKVAPTCSASNRIIKNKPRSVAEKEHLHLVSIREKSTDMKDIISNDKMKDDLADLIDQTTLLDDAPHPSEMDTKDSKETEPFASLEVDRTIISEKNPISSANNGGVIKKIIDNGLYTGSPAQVLYDYFATNPEEINIHEGEHLIVIRTGMLPKRLILDDGTGWTLVNKAGITGIVPTTYIHCIPSDSSQSTLTQPQNHDHGFGTALYTYTKNSSDELSVLAGDTIKIISEGKVMNILIIR